MTTTREILARVIAGKAAYGKSAKDAADRILSAHPILKHEAEVVRALEGILSTEQLTREGGASPEDLSDYEVGLHTCLNIADALLSKLKGESDESND